MELTKEEEAIILELRKKSEKGAAPAVHAGTVMVSNRRDNRLSFTDLVSGKVVTLLSLGAQVDHGIVGARQPTQEVNTDTYKRLLQLPAFTAMVDRGDILVYRKAA